MTALSGRPPPALARGAIWDSRGLPRVGTGLPADTLRGMPRRSSVVAGFLIASLALAAAEQDAPSRPDGGPGEQVIIARANAARDSWWAYRALEKPVAPAVRDAAWVRNEIDRFILAPIEAAGLAPAPEASRETLIRRATYDLTGLPPTPEEVAAFVADRSPDAYERLDDRLLSSPHYGEKWARHWLDLVR